MCSDRVKNSSGIVCSVSRRAGAVAGTSVAISRKIAGYSFKTVGAAKDWLKQPFKSSASPQDKRSSTASGGSAVSTRDQSERKKAAKALIASIESERAASKEMVSADEEIVSQMAEMELDLVPANYEFACGIDVEAATKPTVSEPTDESVAVNQPAEETEETLIAQEQIESSTQKSDEQLSEELSEEQLEFMTKVPSAVTDREVQEAVFPTPTGKVIFSRALIDLASQDVAVRVDAVNAIAGVHHKLSVKALYTHFVSESSPKVRQECVKGLAALAMPESLAAVERALKDEEGPVRLAGVWALYRLAGAKSAPTLVQMFVDQDEEVRRRAATCVGWIGQEEFAVELLPLLYDKNLAVRKAAAKALGALRSRQTVSTLIDRLNDPSESVRKEILSAIETITDKKMSKSFPKTKKEHERLVARWSEWWKNETLG